MLKIIIAESGLKRKVTPDYNLAKIRPDLAKEWNPIRNGDLTPFDVTPASNRKVWWQCKLGHEWKTTMIKRKIYGTGCPFCAHRKVRP
jgi:hypothetical protein